MTLDDLRRFAVTRSLFTPTTLQNALDRLGFVQATRFVRQRAPRTSRCVIASSATAPVISSVSTRGWTFRKTSS